MFNKFNITYSLQQAIIELIYKRPITNFLNFLLCYCLTITFMFKWLKMGIHRVIQRCLIARPTIYSEELATTIIMNCLINGESLRAICTSKYMPDKATIFRWLGSNSEFCDQYKLAREIQADMLADDLLNIADTVYCTGDALTKAKLQIQTRMWIASKLKPRVYGNKPEPQATTQQPPDLNIIIGEQRKRDLAKLTDEQLEQCYQLALANEAKQQI